MATSNPCSNITPSLHCFRTAYSLKRRDVTLTCTEDLTHQSFKDECDINHIMAQYQATGIVDHRNQLPPQWGDVPSLDFHAAVNLVLEAQAKFDALPSQVRERFANDPTLMMAFLRDPANRAEGEKLGLLTPRPPEPPPPAPVPAS